MSKDIAGKIQKITGTTKDERKLAHQLLQQAHQIEEQYRSAILSAIAQKLGELQALGTSIALAISGHLERLQNALIEQMGSKQQTA